MPARCALQPALERAEMRGSEAARALHATITRGLRSIAMLLANSPLVWATCLALPAVTAGEANAEESADQQVRFAQAGASQLRALTVDQPTSRVQRRRVEMRRNENTRARRIVERIAPLLRRPAAPRPAPVA